MACRLKRCSTSSSRSAASRWAKSSRGNFVFRWWLRLPERVSHQSEAIGDDADFHAHGRTHSADRDWRRSKSSKARRRSRASGASGESRSPRTCAAAILAALSPMPSSGSLRMWRCPSAAIAIEYGGQFENLQRSQDATADCRAACLAADFRPALHDVSQRSRRPAGIHRYSLRMGRRHFRPLAARHAVLDLRRHRLHRHVRRGGARRHDPGFLHPTTSTTRAAARRGRDSSRRHAPAAGANDNARRQPWASCRWP